eukprot:m.265821 g.265821  ORF g.265821 m.265821 type:complete len:6112 (+) comp40493_c2_seq23:779-19114(+)
MLSFSGSVTPEKGSPSTLLLTILQNDDANGIVSFSTTSVTVDELDVTNSAQFNIERTEGTFGDVAVTWAIVSPGSDFAQTAGVVTILDSQDNANFTVDVVPDNMPEKDEQFTVQLTKVEGGAKFASDANSLQATLIIRANDSPIRFTSATYGAKEGSNVTLNVTRGVDTNGGFLGDGSISGTSTVDYMTELSGTATANVDYLPKTGSLAFSAGESWKLISIEIVEDQLPEDSEDFSVQLLNPSSGAVLVAPSVASVIIEASDDARGYVGFLSGIRLTIDEDTGNRIVKVELVRSGGSIGRINVNWDVREKVGGALATSVFAVASSSVTFLNGNTTASIDIEVMGDDTPEVAETFLLTLTSVDGGGRLANSGEGVTSREIVVPDSDDAYGVIQLADDGNLTVSKNPRQLRVKILRSGGTFGNVFIVYTVVYFPKGATNPSDGITTYISTPNTISIGSGSHDVTTNNGITDDIFLEVGASFLVTLTRVSLIGTAPVPTPKSPVLGSRTTGFAVIDALTGNGPVGFNVSDIDVSEPSSGSRNLNLLLTRHGASGKATVTWQIEIPSGSKFSTSSDVGKSTDKVVLNDGVFQANVVVEILADNTPELDEQFIVKLTSVAEGEPQRIDASRNNITVTILANEKAGGTFQFSDASKGPFDLKESAQTFKALYIQRTDGDLTREELVYEIAGGTDDFNDARGKLFFSPGETLKALIVSPVDDNIPELNETYTVKLTSTSASLGPRTSVEITILQNDDANGVLLFLNSPKAIAIGETSNGASSFLSANFVVQRSRGLFGAISVEFNISAQQPPLNIDSQLRQSPSSVVLNFANDEAESNITLSSLPDNITESAQNYKITLLPGSVTGGARLADLAVETTATFTIEANDDEVFFPQPKVSVVEGAGVNLTVNRVGQLKGTADVMYIVANATADPVDYGGVVQGMITFRAGEDKQFIYVQTVDDSLPEADESFTVELVSVSGDAVLSRSTKADVTILANDDANGIIQFADSSVSLTGTEGKNVTFNVERQRGTFGEVQVIWEIIGVKTGILSPPGQDISQTSGTLVFKHGDKQASIVLNVVADGMPELEEMFSVLLLSVVPDVNVQPGASLGSQTTANLTVPKNDDANGLLELKDPTIDLPEDVDSGGVTPGSVNVTISRQRGLFGKVKVLWNVFPRDSPNLQDFTDLFFESMLGSGVTDVSATDQRQGSETPSLSFPGNEVSGVFVPESRHPDNRVISLGFTMSAWIKPLNLSAGVILVKGSDDAVTRYYGLALIPRQGSQIAITFYYTPSGPKSTNQTGFETVESVVSSSSLLDKQWHHLAVSVGNGEADFYLDGNLLSTEALLDERVFDDDQGELLVGGLLNGDVLYVGLMQDVRIYSSQLTEKEIDIIGTNRLSLAFTPIAGVTTFAMGSDAEDVQFLATSDVTPEPDELFTLALQEASGGAALSEKSATANMTLMRSDNANGLFGFSAVNFDLSAPGEPSQLILTVTRSRGTFGTATVSWEVRQILPATDPFPLASSDFNQATGTLTFKPNVTSMDLTLHVTADKVPELAENFVVTLISASPADGHVASSPTSSASVDPAFQSLNVTVQANDDPYGLMEFTTESPPTSADPVTPPAVIQPEVSVDESDGTVTLTVVRANGLNGDVSVEFRTVDGTALNGKDYAGTAGTLSFKDGERFKLVTVSLVDNKVPELEKAFSVRLENPKGVSGVPRLGVGKDITVRIRPSDNAFGVVAFTPSSLAVSVNEMAAPVSLDVLRTGGSLGPVTIYWEAEQAAAIQDLSPYNGSVTLDTGNTAGVINFIVSDDAVPELAEVFTIRLTSVTGGGSLSSAGDVIATISVASSDFPHGRFVFTPGNRPLRAPEANADVTLTVIREFGTMGSVEIDYATLSRPPSKNVASAELDYNSASGTLSFVDGEKEKNFTVSLKDDSIPELDESFWVNLTSVTLTAGQTSNNTFPEIGAGGLGEVIIEENDDARGVIELSVSNVTVAESFFSANFVSVRRSAGTFGDVTVSWSATAGSAKGKGVDYDPDGGSVVLREGQTSFSLPLRIIDDNLPEFNEDFTVRLTSGGAARLGSQTASVVTIEQNDDPNGVFEFDDSSLNFEVDEPESGSTPVVFTLKRTGGGTGVVGVHYEARIQGALATGDVSTAERDIFLLSDQFKTTFTIDIQADDDREGREILLVNLTSAAMSVPGIPRIGVNRVATVIIRANDAPHGFFNFNQTQYTVNEGTGETYLTLKLSRSLGTVGEAQVTYRTQRIKNSVLAVSDGFRPLDFFSSPALGSLTSSFSNFTAGSNTLESCTVSCLDYANQQCLSFSYNARAKICLRHLEKRDQNDQNFIADSSYVFYQKDVTKVEQDVLRRLATAGNDYETVISGVAIIPDAGVVGSINVTIKPDNVAELNESFHVILTGVSLTSGPTDGASNEPALGNAITATITITQNDNPYGLFEIQSPLGVKPEGEEKSGFKVDLEVLRTAGTFGDVAVEWYSSDVTAVSPSDYTAPGAVLIFKDGVGRQTVQVAVVNDAVPEVDETLIVGLRNATAGSVISDSKQNITVTILANDDVAGVFQFDAASRSAIVTEGSSFSMTVERLISAIGTVVVDWRIVGNKPDDEFETTSGSVTFSPGQNSSVISLKVRTDSTPELAEVFTLELYNITTTGVSATGAATFDPSGTTASLTISASNDPHGTIQFSSGSLKVTTAEGNKSLSLTLVRQFGSIGTIDVSYQAVVGSKSAVVKDKLALASTPLDFKPSLGNVALADGVNSAQISVDINDDSVPEVDEAFLVNLTSVVLVSGGDGKGVPPRLGSDSTAEIIIQANDGTEGEFTFAVTSQNITEDIGVLNIEILRTKGTFGVVSVFAFVSEAGATGSGEDFLFTPTLVTFLSGESQKTVNIVIEDDDDPELEERFIVSLSNPTGAALGDVTTMTVTIDENDEPYGVVLFDSSSLRRTVVESSTFQLTIIRTRGTTGTISVLWNVSAVSDLTPRIGKAVFQDGEQQKTVDLTVVGDGEPELEETYVVSLQDPTGGAFLSTSDTTATITIPANEDPNGVLQITSSSPNGVEENAGFVKTTITRSAGKFGRLTCQIFTQDGGAVAGQSSQNVISIVQNLATDKVEDLTSFSYDNSIFLLLASGNRTGALQPIPTVPDDGDGGSGAENGTGPDTGSNTPITPDNINFQEDPGMDSGLYRWNGGGFDRLQSISTDGAKAWVTFQLGNFFMSAVANAGSRGRTEVSSRLYQLQENNFQPTQEFFTKGASDVIAFESTGNTFLIFANREDNSGKTDIDSTVYKREAVNFKFHANIPTKGAVALATFRIANARYLVIGNSFSTTDASSDINSQVLEWDPRGESFSVVQGIPTLALEDVHDFTMGGNHYLVFVNGKTDVDSFIYKWNASSSEFQLLQNLRTKSARSAETFISGSDVFLVIGSETDNARIFKRNSTTELFSEVAKFNVGSATDILPIKVGSNIYLASGTSNETSVVFFTEAGPSSDFIARTETLIFEQGVTTVDFLVGIVNDTTPEINETFTVELSSLTGGARFASGGGNLTVDILTNDDAHGLISFASVSLSVIVDENVTDSPLTLNLIREKGTFGEVQVAWNASGDVADISPRQGTVVFPDGVNKATLTLSILADDTSEIDEMVVITLTDVLGRGGVPEGADVSRKAKIVPTLASSVISVRANDDPHGVIIWSPSSLTVQTPELDAFDSVVPLTVVREFGSFGDIIVNYSTGVATHKPADSRATPDADFVAVINGSVKIMANETSAVVPITIKHDDVPEIGEFFFVNLTSVSLMNFSSNATIPHPRIGKNFFSQIEIQENDNFRGIFVFSVNRNDDGTVHVDENAGIFLITVERTSGTFGLVGCSWTVTQGTAVGSGVDFSLSDGTLRWSPGDRFKTIPVQIVNDNIPEIGETFTVRLESPTDGARLGDDAAVTVTIAKNDDANGRFLFDPKTSQVVPVSESENATDPRGVVTLTVLRLRGLFGTVEMDWEVEVAGWQDLSPTSGRLTFPQDVDSQNIVIRAVHDDIPESDERYIVTLSNITGGGVLDANRATVFILQNGDANGVILISPESRFLVLSEAGLGATGSYSVSLIRNAGSFGNVDVEWRISPSDSKGFVSESGKVTFVPQQQNTTIDLYVTPDSTPELSRTFTLNLERVLGGARLDTDPEALSATLLVAASDNPHGIVQFSSPFTRTVSEGIGRVTLGLTRLFGSFGTLRVNFTTNGSQPIMATDGSDYSTNTMSVEITGGQQSGSIEVDISDDSLPELTESFFVRLTSVELLSDDLNTSVVQGVQIDTPPSLGIADLSYVSISENDDAYGRIEFDVLSRKIDLSETARTHELTLIRSGGAFGVIAVKYRAKNGTALGNGVDFDLGFDGNGTITFIPEQRRASFNVTIIDDSAPEIFESFSIELVSALDGAVLGTESVAVITIGANDDPSGIVGFDDASLNGLVVVNPSIKEGNKVVNFNIHRTAGDVGLLEVKWELVGPFPGREFQDVTPSQGVVFISDKVRSGVLSLVVIADDTSELEETFRITLKSVAGGALLDSTRTNTTLTIPLHGEPFGVIEFYAESLTNQLAMEPANASVPIAFPVQRTEGTVGDITIYWKIGNVNKSSDISPLSGVLNLADGDTQGRISLDILPEPLPELQKSYTVVLVNATGGAKVGANNRAVFTIQANDVPHGIFGILSPEVVKSAPGDGRNVSFTINRLFGAIGDVNVSYTITYSQPTQSPYVQSSGEVVLTDGAASVTVQHNVSSSAFLLLGEAFSITLTAVDLLTLGADDIPPALGKSASSAKAIVTSVVANSVVQFGDTSLQLAVNDSTSLVDLTVSRRGVYGPLTTPWSAGSTTSSFSNGTVQPSTAILRFADGESTKLFSVRATPLDPHGKPEIFVLRLTSVASAVQGGAVLDSNRLSAFIEPHGVVQFAPTSLSMNVSETAGSLVLTVWRQYGSDGQIEVSYATRNRSSGRSQYNALPVVDYAPMDTSLQFSNGQTATTITIPIINNDIPEDDEVFYVDLTSTQSVPVAPRLLPSPRFNDAFTLCTVTIKDDDDPRGVFTFAEAEKVVTEEDITGTGTRVVLRVERKRGLFSQVSVVVRTFGGGENWKNFTSGVVPAAEAQVNVDYQILNEVLTFDEGVAEVSVTLVIYNDDVAEIDEGLYIQLVNPTGGSTVGSSPTYDPVIKITIYQNDLPNGLIGFKELMGTLNEDDPARSSIDVVVERDRGFFGAASVDWQAARIFGSDADPGLTNELITTSGSVQFNPGQTEVTIRLSLKSDDVPESASSFVIYLKNPSSGSDIYNNRNTFNVTIEPSDDAFGVLQFAPSSRLSAVSEDARSVTLYIQRIGGSLGAVTVKYTTRSAGSSDDLSIGSLQGIAAEAGIDYVNKEGTVFFAETETLKSITITLASPSNPGSSIKVFYVTLSNPADGAQTGSFPEAAVRITPVDASLELSLLLIEADLQSDLTPAVIENAAQKLNDQVQALVGTNSRELDVYLHDVEIVIEKGASLFTRNTKNLLMGIFNYMIENAKFKGKASIALTLQKFAFSLVRNARCLEIVNASSTERLEENSLTVTAMRAMPSEINGKKLETSEGNTVTLPAGLVKQIAGDPAKCRDLYFIHMRSQTWFQDGDAIFNEADGGKAQVLSVGLNVSDSEVQNLANMLVYRINTERRVKPNSGECVYWHYQSGRWLTDGCSKKSQIIDQNYIECECNHLTDFGARGQTDSRVGWGAAIQASCFVAMLCLLLVWLIHNCFACCGNSPMLISIKLLMHLVFATFVTEVILVAAIYSSKTASAEQCGALGGLLHFFAIAQFTCMMVVSINLWQTLVAGNDETDRYYFVYILLAWATPAAVLALYVLIGHYAVGWELSVVYGDVHDNGDMCFITNVYGGLVAGALPVLVCVVAMALVFTQAYQLPSRWKQYDDVYRNVDNKEEIPKLLLLFLLSFLTWLMASLHLSFSTTVTEVLFALFNIAMSLYILFVYFFLRLRNLKERGGFYPADVLGESAYPMAAMHREASTSKVSLGSHGSKRILVADPGGWRDTESPPPPISPGPEGHIGPAGVAAGARAAPGAGPDSPEFDDLIFALRTGGNLPPEEHEDEADDDDDDDIAEEKARMTEHYEMRRISITDTRL